MRNVRQFAVSARVFTLVAIGAAALVGDVPTSGVPWIAILAITAQAISLTRRVPEALLVILEGGATALLAVAVFPDFEAALPYLATPALIGGIVGGLRLVIAVLAAEAVAIGASSWLILGRYEAEMAGSVLTWLATGLGLGLLGTFTRRNISRVGMDASYRSALDLIRQLHALSGRLTSGLDPVDLADQAIAIVTQEIVVSQTVVVLRHGDAFTPLRFANGGMSYPLDTAEQLMRTAWQSGRPAIGGKRVALPMETESDRVAVILFECATMPSSKSLDRIMEQLETATVRLNAALLFTSVRESATSEERHRLAREVHDGVAQDVASLGYLVDNLAASVTTEDQEHDVALLRKEVTRVVGELRNSVFDLRNETGVGQGLGQSIASFARHVGSHSAFTVHVTLDESAIRLRPRIESELLRIAQEAINNARRHSGGENLWVSCRVHPPRAEIDIVDDGEGMGAGRDDSHGVRIMRERADRVGADLDVISPARDGRGTCISLRLE